VPNELISAVSALRVLPISLQEVVKTDYPDLVERVVDGPTGSSESQAMWATYLMANWPAKKQSSYLKSHTLNASGAAVWMSSSLKSVRKATVKNLDISMPGIKELIESSRDSAELAQVFAERADIWCADQSTIDWVAATTSTDVAVATLFDSVNAGEISSEVATDRLETLLNDKRAKVNADRARSVFEFLLERDRKLMKRFCQTSAHPLQRQAAAGSRFLTVSDAKALAVPSITSGTDKELRPNRDVMSELIWNPFLPREALNTIAARLEKRTLGLSNMAEVKAERWITSIQRRIKDGSHNDLSGTPLTELKDLDVLKLLARRWKPAFISGDYYSFEKLGRNWDLVALLEHLKDVPDAEQLREETIDTVERFPDVAAITDGHITKMDLPAEEAQLSSCRNQIPTLRKSLTELAAQYKRYEDECRQDDLEERPLSSERSIRNLVPINKDADRIETLQERCGVLESLLSSDDMSERDWQMLFQLTDNGSRLADQSTVETVKVLSE
jgi:hypothetical protein